MKCIINSNYIYTDLEKETNELLNHIVILKNNDKNIMKVKIKETRQYLNAVKNKNCISYSYELIKKYNCEIGTIYDNIELVKMNHI